MILSAIEIENYKQYAGCHRVEFPEQGLVAVTGPNGAGKTTLFEAIEWCLYCPRQIPLASVPPHGGSGHTTVRLTLHDPLEDRRYVVERKLRSGNTQAEVYGEENPGEPIVQGTKQVTEYVARTLIGLPHAAFVSTFFTRQKELSFFGAYGATERRTEVARLLGFEAIRAAHGQIGEERTAARNAAASLRAQYERESADRDFAAEIAAAEVATTEAQNAAAAAAQQASAADGTSADAHTELERCRDLQAKDGVLQTGLAAIAGEAAVAQRSLQGAEDELRRLEARSQERLAALSRAVDLAVLAAALQEHEAERQRADRRSMLEDAGAAAAVQLNDVAREIAGVVARCDGTGAGLTDWAWREADACDPATAADRFAVAASGVADEPLRKRVEHLLSAQHWVHQAEGHEQTLQKYRDRLAVRQDQLSQLLAKGDPRLLIGDARSAIVAATDAVNGARLKLSTIRAARNEAEASRQHLHDHAQDQVCPTCTRPLSAGEAESLLQLLTANIERLLVEEEHAERMVYEATVCLTDAQRKEQDLSERLRELENLESRLRDGTDLIEDIETKHTAAMASLQAQLLAAGLSSPPSEAEIAAARAAADLASQVRAQAPALAHLGRQARDAQRVAQESADAIAALGIVAYDFAAHRAARLALDDAQHAAAQVQQIDRELADRPRYEQQRAAAAAEAAALAVRRATLEAERQALGYSDAALAAARQAYAAAQAAAREWREKEAAAQRVAREAETASRRAIAERDRIQQLLEDAERKGREADDLERMYQEFARFDQHVADHIGPLLAETTERLLSLVTEGKYDRVRFDNSYGIDVFDDDEPFPLESFSGGERDVVALCARLAMSELVGSSATRPPRFLVLDEVFGSLDSERRGQLLQTLGALASGGHFQQMFIISHVDDVQQAPVMNEAWTIEERDGVSRVVQPSLLAGVAS